MVSVKPWHERHGGPQQASLPEHVCPKPIESIDWRLVFTKPVPRAFSPTTVVRMTYFRGEQGKRRFLYAKPLPVAENLCQCGFVSLVYTLTGRQASSLHNVKIEQDAAFPDASASPSMAST